MYPEEATLVLPQYHTVERPPYTILGPYISHWHRLSRNERRELMGQPWSSDLALAAILCNSTSSQGGLTQKLRKLWEPETFWGNLEKFEKYVSQINEKTCLIWLHMCSTSSQLHNYIICSYLYWHWLMFCQLALHVSKICSRIFFPISQWARLAFSLLLLRKCGHRAVICNSRLAKGIYVILLTLENK